MMHFIICTDSLRERSSDLSWNFFFLQNLSYSLNLIFSLSLIFKSRERKSKSGRKKKNRSEKESEERKSNETTSSVSYSRIVLLQSQETNVKVPIESSLVRSKITYYEYKLSFSTIDKVIYFFRRVTNVLEVSNFNVSIANYLSRTIDNKYRIVKLLH